MRTVKTGLLTAALFLGAVCGAYASGTVSGRVIYAGTVPAPEAQEVKSDAQVCGSHKEAAKILVGADQGVQNAVVRIVGLKNEGEAKDGYLDQLNCEFVPHVQAIATGKKIVITSSDAVLHNAHGFYEDGSTAFNLAVPVVGMEVSKKLEKPGAIRLRCDAGHTWMKAFLYVTDDRTAVTDESGKFSLDGVPAGTYEVEVWQEWSGIAKQTVTVTDGGNSDVTVSLVAPETL